MKKFLLSFSIALVQIPSIVLAQVPENPADRDPLCPGMIAARDAFEQATTVEATATTMMGLLRFLNEPVSTTQLSDLQDEVLEVGGADAYAGVMLTNLKQEIALRDCLPPQI